MLVAYSGGADSAFLLAAAVRALGADKVAAATGYSHSLPMSERDPAREFAESLGVEVLTPETHEMEREGYRANAGDRCYFCKAELLDVLDPDRRRARARPRRHRHQRRRRRSPASGPASGPPPSATRSRRCATPASPRSRSGPPRAAGACRPGTSRPPPASRRGSRTASRSPRTGSAASSVPRSPSAPLLADAGLVNLRVRDLGERASVEIDAALLPLDAGGRGRALLDAVRRAGFAEAAVDPRGFRSGSMNEAL